VSSVARNAPFFRLLARLLAIAVVVLTSRVALTSEKPDVRAAILAPASAAAGSRATVIVEMTVGTDWHVNSHTPSEKYLIPANVSLAASDGDLSPVRYPNDVERRFPFSDKPLRVYEGTVRFETDLQLAPGATSEVSVKGSLSYQACNEQQCFAPAKIPLETRVPVVAAQK
jgi:cytochrome c biogenesis DsbD-like protein